MYVKEYNHRGARYWKNEDGHLHREDGPAMHYVDGTKIWYRNGIIHRLDGPAYIDPNGKNYWVIEGHECTNEIQQWAKYRDIDLDNLTQDDIDILRIEILLVIGDD